jgi:hypothetical protein
VSETFSTLQFASLAKRVKNKASVNEVVNDQAQLKRQKKEIIELTNALEVRYVENMEVSFFNIPISKMRRCDNKQLKKI